MLKRCVLPMTLLTALAVQGLAQASVIDDPVGDFIPVYAGPHNGDLDVVRAEGRYDGATFDLSATVHGAVGQTQGGKYVWGLDRGQGTAKFAAVAPGVLFDAVVIVDPDAGTAVVNDFVTGKMTMLSGAAVTVHGDQVTVKVPKALLPSQGLKDGQYLVNLWPRDSLVGGTETISDFAPDNSDARLTLDFPLPVQASAQTEVVFDDASLRFDNLLGQIDAARGDSGHRVHAFAFGGGRFGNRGGGDSLLGDSTTHSATVGATFSVAPGLQLGLAYAQDRTTASLKGGGRLRARVHAPTLLAGWRDGGAHVEGMLAYGTVRYDMNRVLPVGGQALQATSSPDGKALSIGLRGGYDFGHGPLQYGPVVDVLATRAHVDGYSEAQAEDLGATVHSRSRWSRRLGAGFRIGYAHRVDWGTVAAHAQLRAVQELGDRRDRIQAAFSVQPDAGFAVLGPDTGTTYGSLALGVDLATRGQFRVGVSYAPRFDQHGLIDQGATLSVSQAF